MFITSFVGIAVERIGYRPLRQAPRASAAITGLTIGIILETGNLAILGADPPSFPALIETQIYEYRRVFLTNKKIMIVVVSFTAHAGFAPICGPHKMGYGDALPTAYDFVVVPLMGVPLNTLPPRPSL